MGATVQRDGNGIWITQIYGVLRKEEMDAVQAAGIEALGPHDEVKLLVMVAEDFRGWVGGEVWNDMSFFMEHGDRIVKIAIVGDPKWESRMLMFTCAGFRRAPVKYYSREKRAEAYDWLNENS